MTEADWLACTDPQALLEFARGKVSARRLRAFALACCRQIWSGAADEPTRTGLAIMERLAAIGPLPEKPQVIRVSAGQIVIDCSATDPPGLDLQLLSGDGASPQVSLAEIPATLAW